MKTSGLEPEPCSLKVRHSANRVLFPSTYLHLNLTYKNEITNKIPSSPSSEGACLPLCGAQDKDKEKNNREERRRGVKILS